ncbi:hypothetical protein D3C87_1575640 [compost metagenome]
MARWRVSPVLQRGFGLFHLAQHHLGVPVQELARVGGAYSARPPEQQGGLKFAFEVSHVLAQGRLCNMQGFGGGRNAFQLDDAGEVLELSEIHR